LRKERLLLLGDRASGQSDGSTPQPSHTHDPERGRTPLKQTGRLPEIAPQRLKPSRSFVQFHPLDEIQFLLPLQSGGRDFPGSPASFALCKSAPPSTPSPGRGHIDTAAPKLAPTADAPANPPQSFAPASLTGLAPEAA